MRTASRASAAHTCVQPSPSMPSDTLEEMAAIRVLGMLVCARDAWLKGQVLDQHASAGRMARAKASY